MQNARPAAIAAFLNDLAHPVGQGARITEGGTPALGPVMLDEDWVARTEGWEDDAQRQKAHLDLLALGARIVTDRAAIGDDVQCRDEIHEGILDRIASGTFTFPGTPTPSGVRKAMYRATREVWRNLMAVRHDGAAWDAALERGEFGPDPRGEAA